MNFGQALTALYQGKKVAREVWKNKGLWVELQVPDANSKMTVQYTYLNYPDNHKHNPGAKVPWTANQMEQFAEDWYILE